jgi:hypothetical protein
MSGRRPSVAPWHHGREHRLRDPDHPSEEPPDVPDDPSGIGPDRAVIDRVDDDTAVLLVGPGHTEVHVPAADLPEDVGAGTWVMLDLQLQPPLVLGEDPELTGERAAELSRRLAALRPDRSEAEGS